MNTVPLGQVAQINPRYKKPDSLWLNRLVSFVPMKAVSEKTGRIEDQIERPISAVLKGYTAFNRGDLLLAKITPCFENGKVAIADIRHEIGFGSTEFHVIRPHPDQLDIAYLFHFLRHPKIQYLGETRMIGSAGQKRLPKNFLKDLSIPLPPLPEQRRIAAILDKADELRVKRRAALDKLDRLLESIFVDMFGDPVRNPKGWEVVPLSHLLTFLTSGSRGWAKYYSHLGTVFLRIQNVRHGELKLDDLAYVQAPDTAQKRRTTVQSGDVLLSITADLGRTAVIPSNFPTANINQHLAILRVSGILPEYLSAFLSSPGGQIQFQKLNRQGVKAGLNFNDIKSLKIMVPPKHLQETFLSVSNRIRQQIYSQKKVLEVKNNLFHALQQRAFRGELTCE